jgi:hypothetical protein
MSAVTVQRPAGADSEQRQDKDAQSLADSMAMAERHSSSAPPARVARPSIPSPLFGDVGLAVIALCVVHDGTALPSALPAGSARVRAGKSTGCGRR